MAEDTERLTDQEIAERAEAWFAEKWIPGRHCSVCGESEWALARTGQLYTYGSGAVGGGGEHYPLLIVNCANCGLNLLFSARILGEIDPASLDRRPGVSL
jgi:hypothetical protein